MYYPNRGATLFQNLEATLMATFGRKLTGQELATISGQSLSTMFDWINGSNLRQVEAIIRLLEQLPEAARAELINKVCRALPTFADPRLAWKESQVLQLEQLLQQKAGLTILEGTEDLRNFMITTLGHTSSRLAPEHQEVAGIDVRLPSRFVPIKGVVYLNQPAQLSLVVSQVEQVLDHILQLKNRLVVLNGIWNAFPQLQDKITTSSTQRHVIISDHKLLKVPEAATTINLSEVDGHIQVITQHSPA